MYSKPLFHDKSDSIYHAKEENMAKYLGEDAVSQMAALGKYDNAEEKRRWACCAGVRRSSRRARCRGRRDGNGLFVATKRGAEQAAVVQDDVVEEGHHASLPRSECH